MRCAIELRAECPARHIVEGFHKCMRELEGRTFVAPAQVTPEQFAEALSANARALGLDEAALAEAAKLLKVTILK